jgi:hypothetical protein
MQNVEEDSIKLSRLLQEHEITQAEYNWINGKQNAHIAECLPSLTEDEINETKRKQAVCIPHMKRLLRERYDSMITTKANGRKTGWKNMCRDPFRLKTPDGTAVMVRFNEDQVRHKYTLAADDEASSKDATPQDQKRAAKKRAKQAVLLTDQLTVAHKDNSILQNKLTVANTDISVLQSKLDTEVSDHKQTKKRLIGIVTEFGECEEKLDAVCGKKRKEFDSLVGKQVAAIFERLTNTH